MNEDYTAEDKANNGKVKFDWTFGCKGCEGRKALLLQNKNDIIFLVLVLLGLFAVTRIKLV